MALYLNAKTLSTAVKRLAMSLAKPTLSDYLIFKRALVLARRAAKSGATPAAVETGTTNKSFQDAITDLTACDIQGGSWTGPPHFSPFGAERDLGAGYKSKKYRSNGPSDTVGRWQSRAGTPLKLVPDTSPKQFTFEPRSLEELRDFFITSSGGGLPTLFDAACWLFRHTDFHPMLGGAQPTAVQLVDEFKEELGLEGNEVKALFVTQLASASMGFSDTASAPTEYLPPPPTAPKSEPPSKGGGQIEAQPASDEMDALIAYIRGQGFWFEPWQVAAYVTAVRTKPFVILAGISGTGKSKLPRLVANGTGAECIILAVRPDWHDSSALIGYRGLDTRFVPGDFLRAVKKAQGDPGKQYFVLLDEMNLARVEYYLAEILSRIEDRHKTESGIQSELLVPNVQDAEWKDTRLPPNLCIVGSVNMDETTHGFSKKVLDRSFVIEFSDIDLSQLGALQEKPPQSAKWKVEQWRQEHLVLMSHPNRDSDVVKQVVSTLLRLNEILQPIQLQVGYRVRDEVAMFCLNSEKYKSSFVLTDMGPVDPLDLAITMKVLPRIQGGGPQLDNALKLLLEWATGEPVQAPPSDAGVSPIAQSTPGASTGSPNPGPGLESAGAKPENKGEAEVPVASGKARSFPLCAERLRIMLQRLADTGFTSYWM